MGALANIYAAIWMQIVWQLAMVFACAGVVYAVLFVVLLVWFPED